MRADGLDSDLAVNREALFSGKNLGAFRVLLGKMFNAARAEYKIRVGEQWPDAGDLLVDKWGTAPLAPLHRAVSEFVGPGLELPPFIRSVEEADLSEQFSDWEKEVKIDEANILEGVTFVRC